MTSREKRGGPALPKHHKFSLAAIEGQVKELIQDNEKLKQQVESYKQVDQLKAANAGLSKQVKTYQKDLKSQKADRDRSENRHKHQIDRLRKQIDYYKEGYDKLMVSQAACLFEQAICSHVLPAVYAKNKFVSIRQLLNYLNDDSEKLPEALKLSEDESKLVLEEARQKWKDLCLDVLEFPSDCISRSFCTNGTHW